MSAAVRMAGRIDPFILAMLATVALATIFPLGNGGADLLDAVTTLAIAALFFLHGVRLDRVTLIGGLRHWRLHLTILAITFLLFPLVGLCIVASARALTLPVPGSYLMGILYTALLPSTVQSSIAFTSIARGNVAAAICAAALSNMAGVFLTPLLVRLLLAQNGGDFSIDQMAHILLYLGVPFVAGHMLRPWLGRWAEKRRGLLKLTDRGTILLAVYGSFSAATLNGLWRSARPVDIILLVCLCAILLAIMMMIVTALARAGGFSRADRVAILFAGSKKSLASGVPMARVLFPAATAGAILLPLMIFHQLQLIFCAWLARRYAATSPTTEQRFERKDIEPCATGRI